MAQDILPLSNAAAAQPIEVLPPLISIIIPTFNHLDLLRRCVNSIIAFTDLSTCEIVVVANGCTDDTEGFLRATQALYPMIRYVVKPEAMGFTAATNLGIQLARGEYMVLLNNDTVLLQQDKNTWIQMLLAPFCTNPKTGITGPVKFSADYGGIERRVIAFWCAMIPRKLFDELGPLDEAFNPGMGEDGDFSIKAEMAGYKLAQVPTDGSAAFGEGISSKGFPIFHLGSGTFGDADYSEINRRNTALLISRYGRKDDIDVVYQLCLTHASDTNELFPTFRSYTEKCSHVTEFGVRGVFTTWAFLAGRPKRMVSYDIEYNPNIEGAKKEALRAGILFEFRQENTLEAVIEPTDLLFIDTTHTYVHLKAELERHADKVRKWIMVHDTETFGDSSQDGTSPGEKQAIAEFLAAHPEWTQKEHLPMSNGLTVLERKALLCSIVIPTCGKDWSSVLATCLKLVDQFTDLSDKEVIVVANGAPDEAIAHLKTLPVRILDFPDRLGYIRAVNVGIKASQSSHVVLLDDDSFLMAQDKDTWIKMLLKPFLQDGTVGAAGPFGQTYEDLGQVLHSGCTMYRKDVLEEVGLFDEAFNPGYMGDEDLAIRIRKAGHRIVRVPEGPEPKYVNGVFEIQFPVLHTGTVNTMDKHGVDLPLVKKNRDLLLARHVGMGASFRPEGCNIGVRPKVSIVIPTAFAKLEDLLKPNLESIVEYTDLANVEVIVVANGCTDDTEGYVKSLGPPFRVISFPDALGYTRATNEGIKVSTGDYIVLFNNDNVLLPQPKNDWMNKLLDPFKDPKMGITGPLQLHDDYADQDVIIGFCLCIPRKVLSESMAHTGGLLDEIYSPGGGEDIDLCCRVKAKGYITRQVPVDGKQGFSHQNTGDFMIYHKNNQTFKDIDEYTRFIIKKNGLVNAKKYNRNLKLNLGSGGIEYPGFLSVDLLDRRASIIMDITKLDFPENSVLEMICIHAIEHLSPFVVLDTLKLWNRILKPGGKLTLELPDLESLCERYLKANTGQRYGLTNCIYGAVNTRDYGEVSDISSPHLYGWDRQMMFDMLCNAGFVNIQFMPERFPHPEPPNMSVDAYKP